LHVLSLNIRQCSGERLGKIFSPTTPASIGATPVNRLDDECTLSIFANGAYYLSGARLREIGVALLGVQQARGGVDVPSPEKHR
jgi:hypothetical protein